MAETRDYDVILFGASGFTGQFVAEELFKLQSEGGRTLKWAAAGRNDAKVRAMLQTSGIDGVDVMMADVADQDSLDAMCAKATVVINCVGPFQLYGEPVVKACISQKCNYVDITGESYFMETIEAKYDDQAREAGVYIVSSCAFDCIPNDLGALLLQRTFSGELAYVESYVVVSDEASFNTGTWNSMLHSIKALKKLKKFRKERNQPPLPLPNVRPPKSDVAQRWCFPSPSPDKAVVYRSQRYRHENEGISPYKFSLYFGLRSFWQAIGIMIFFLVMLLMLLTDFGLNLMIKFPGLFSAGTAKKNGPSRKEIENVTFTVILNGTGYSPAADRSKPPNSKLTVKVWGVDPGYHGTSAMVVQSALCIVDEKDSLPPSGGVYTPAVAFGNTKLIQNLENTGKVKFEVIPQ